MSSTIQVFAFAVDPNRGYRPLQWNKHSPASVSPPLTILTAPTQSGAVSLPGVLYVFDNALHALHEQDLEITNNPVQTGASISDHSYIQPARLTVQVLMSDSMQSYVVGQFTGTQGRSVSAYQTLLALQESQSFLQVATRLRSYSNMLIKSVRPEEDVTSRYGLKCSITFQQVLVASVEVTTSNISFGNSDIPEVTDSSSSGPVQTTQPSDAVVAGNNVPVATTTSTVAAINSASIDGTSQNLPSSATGIMGAAAGISSNVNQLPQSINTVASNQGFTLPVAAATISGFSATVNSLARATGVNVPVRVIAPVTYTALAGANVVGSGNWSSSNVSNLAGVISGVVRH